MYSLEDLKNLPVNSKQKIFVWSNDARGKVTLDSLFVGINPNELAIRGDVSADFLVARSIPYDSFRKDTPYNFGLYECVPEDLKLQEGIWVFPTICSPVVYDPFSFPKLYEKYGKIATENGLIGGK